MKPKVLVIVDGEVYHLQPEKDDDLKKLGARLEEFVEQANETAGLQEETTGRLNDLTRELVHLKEMVLKQTDLRCDHCNYVGEGERGGPCPNCNEGVLI